jgi:hypothetical protein
MPFAFRNSDRARLALLFSHPAIKPLFFFFFFFSSVSSTLDPLRNQLVFSAP